MVETALERGTRTKDPQTYLTVLAKLRHFVVERKGLEAPVVVDVVAQMADVARRGGLQEAREGAYRWLVGAFQVQGQPERAVDALLALARAKSDAGQADEAETLYREAQTSAEALGDPVRQSRVMRNFALFLAERKRPDAEDLFARATDVARASNDDEIWAKAWSRKAFMFSTAASWTAPRPCLQEALQHLDALHPDALTARGHLHALETGGECGGASKEVALTRALRALALPQLPEGLVAELAVKLDERQRIDVEVRLCRAATEDELEHMNRVLNHALTQLQQGPSKPRLQLTREDGGDVR